MPKTIETGSSYHPSGNEHWITPVANLFIEHPKVALTVTSAIAGVAIGMAVKPLAYPALTNFIEQLSVALQR